MELISSPFIDWIENRKSKNNKNKTKKNGDVMPLREREREKVIFILIKEMFAAKTKTKTRIDAMSQDTNQIYIPIWFNQLISLLFKVTN